MLIQGQWLEIAVHSEQLMGEAIGIFNRPEQLITYGMSPFQMQNGTAVGEGGTIVRTTDGGNNWVIQVSGTFNTFYDVLFTDANNGTAVGDLGMIKRTTDIGGPELTLENAASLGRGGFAIDLPLSGPSGVEDRSTWPNHKLKITMTFNNTIVSVGGAGSACGGVSDLIIDGNTVTIKLVGVPKGCNGSNNIVTLNDVMDDLGNTLSSASAPVGLLLGDANGDRVVDPADRQYVKSLKGQKIDSTNFRADVSSDGYIGVSDVRLVEQQQGTSLP